jgi:hypothetical protein
MTDEAYSVCDLCSKEIVLPIDLSAGAHRVEGQVCTFQREPSRPLVPLALQDRR